MKDKNTLNWIMERAKGQIPMIFVLSAMRSLVTVLGVIFALTSKNIIDAATTGNKAELWQSATVLFVIIVAQILIKLLGQSVEIKITARLNMRIRTHLFSAILGRDFSALGTYHSGDLLTRISNDAGIISGGIISLVPSVIALLIGLSYALYALIRLDKNFALIFLVGGILLLIAISAFRGVMKNLHKKVQETEGKVRSYFQESLSSILMIKVFGIEKTVEAKGDELQDDNFRAQMKRRNLSIFASSSLGFIFSVGSFYALVHSAYRLYLGVISFGTLTAILQLVGQIQSPFAGLSGVLPRYYAILASAERIIEIESLPEEDSSKALLDKEKTYSKMEKIVFKDISFAYDRDIVLENAELTVNKGDFAVIGGISGIGKSTLIKLLLGVINPTSGEIYIQTNDERICVGKHARPLFSYVPQGNLLLSGTIREAVSIVNEDATDTSIMEAAEVCCAADFIKELPQGLDTHIGEKGFGLSEGQIQRLAITRAILSDAPVILLDEATSALDEETEKRLLENIKMLKGKTCIIISHKRAAFDICNKHIYIENKKIRVEEKES